MQPPPDKAKRRIGFVTGDEAEGAQGDSRGGRAGERTRWLLNLQRLISPSRLDRLRKVLGKGAGNFRAEVGVEDANRLTGVERVLLLGGAYFHGVTGTESSARFGSRHLRRTQTPAAHLRRTCAADTCPAVHLPRRPAPPSHLPRRLPLLASRLLSTAAGSR
jgi:hypothetical protein